MELKTAPEMLGMDYAAWQRAVRQQLSKKRLKAQTMDTPLQARVNCGRWLVDCPCGAGLAADPDWPLACCPECGLQHPVAWPKTKDKKEIERLLTVRKPVNAHWRTGETVAGLKRENKANGLKE